MPTEEELLERSLEKRLEYARQLRQSRLESYGPGILVSMVDDEISSLEVRLDFRRRMNAMGQVSLEGSKGNGWPYITLIPSSKPSNKPYTVTLINLSGIGATCNCPGFGYRARCRHIQIAIEEAQAKGLQDSEPEEVDIFDNLVENAPAEDSDIIDFLK